MMGWLTGQVETVYAVFTWFFKPAVVVSLTLAIVFLPGGFMIILAYALDLRNKRRLRHEGDKLPSGQDIGGVPPEEGSANLP